MFKFVTRIAALLIGIVVTAILAGQCGLLRGQMPPDLGVKAGRLKPPSSTPNSVSSQAYLYPNHPQKVYAAIDPLAFAGDGKLAMRRLAALLQTRERTQIIREESDYIYAQSTTRLMQFTDDLEFWLDEAHSAIQVRSASRLGSDDMGVNRQRVEEIRAQFLKN